METKWNFKKIIFFKKWVIIENTENFILFSREVPLTKPESVKRDSEERLGKISIEVTRSSRKLAITARETKAICEGRGDRAL